MKKNDQSHLEQFLPVLPARGVVAFPKAVFQVEVARVSSILAIQNAMARGNKIFVVAQKDADCQSPDEGDLYMAGTVVQIKQFYRSGDQAYRLAGLGKYRARIKQLRHADGYLTASLERMPEHTVLRCSEVEAEALLRAVRKALLDYATLFHQDTRDFAIMLAHETDPFRLFSMAASLSPLRCEHKQMLLQEMDLHYRLKTLLELLVKETRFAQMEKELVEQAERQIDQNQRNYFLREQAQIIQNELGEDDAAFGDEKHYTEKVEAIEHISKEAKEKLLTDIHRLFRMPDSSHEAYVFINYLDTVLSLPWDQMSEESIDLKRAKKQLDLDHYGLKDVKERILENLAIRIFKPDLKGQIICLVGPPGVGKTSVGRSVAAAMGRKFVRVSLGGVSDESDIRGHRKTYIGAMPGRIITGLMEAKTRNPLVLLDEIDKMGSSFKGDPSSAMLEVLDPEQNCTFTDHYIEVPFDLSDCLFLTTANSVSSIPAPLLDRMEVIELSSYTLEEKFHICKQYLLPKQLKRHGLKASQVRMTSSAIYALADGYTREAGVRSLERNVASLIRKAAKRLAEGEVKSVQFTAKNLESYLGPRRYLSERIEKADQIGLVNGLAWTTVGGELMQIEASILDGKGKVQLTGNLGSIMKESAAAAITYIRSIASSYEIPEDFYQNKDIHIHVPDGAVPKDGPSAGLALVTVLVSALSGRAVRRDVAMTGEITLRGRILPIGGLKEKAIAAYKSGVKTVLIPQENLRDLEEIDAAVKDHIQFIPCKTAGEALKIALVEKSQKQKRPARPNRTASRRQPISSKAEAL